MAALLGSRVRIGFAALNALVALILLVAVFGLLKVRFWGIDLPAAMISLAEIVSAVALFRRLPWAMRALAVSAWITFVLGLILVGLIVLTMVFLRSIHGEDGLAATAISGLIVALIVPYTLVVPAAQLLWLKQQPSESGS
ncbi:MAG TPA: hypothetical protein VGM44_23005 [Polyangiaceae bacterium]|jgi:hypothetical protein